MPDEPIIHNGDHTDEPLGRLTGLDGRIILIWSKEPTELLSAMIEAIGPLPDPVSYGVGGYMEETGAATVGPWGKVVSTYTYNPAGDVINQAKATEFAALVTAYNARVQAIQAVVLVIASKA